MRKLVALLAFFSVVFPLSAQVGIGTSTPNTSSILDLTATDKGFLAPRMTLAERDAITSPANGLLIFNTSTNKFNVYASGAWVEILSGTVPGDNLGNHTATQNIQLNGQYLSGDGDNEGITVDGSGNVGVNTSSTFGSKMAVNLGSNNNLMVYGDNPYLRLGSNMGTERAGLGMVTSAGTFLPTSAVNDLVIRDISSNGNILFGTNNGTTQERMRIAANGNVGIGQVLPKSMLQISSYYHIFELDFGTEKYDLLNYNAYYDGSTLRNELAGVAHMQLFGNDNGIPVWGITQYDGLAANSDLFSAAPSARLNFRGGGLAINADATTAGLRVISNGPINSIFQKASDGTTLPVLAFETGTGDYINLTTPASVTGPYTLTLPENAGSNGQVLSTDGSGNLSWATSAGDNLGNHTATQKILAVSGDAINPGYSFNSDINSGIFNPADNQLAFSTDGAERMRIIGNGNVGFGTNNPTRPLQVQTISGMHGISHTDGTVELDSYIGGGEALFGTVTNHPFGLFTNNASPSLYLTNVGFVGVGTTGPITKFHVRHTDGGTNTINTVATFTHTTSGTAVAGIGTKIGFETQNGVGTPFYGGYTGITATNVTDGAETADYFIATRNAGTSTEKVRVTGAGNMGLGTSTPATTLDMNGDLALREGASVSISANQLNPGNFSHVRITNTGTINEILNPQNGKVLYIVNNSGGDITIGNNAVGGSTKIYTLAGGNFRTSNGTVTQFVYNASMSGWLMTSSSVANSTNVNWGLTGNAGTSAATNFIGTTDDNAVQFKVNNVKSGKIDASTGSNAFFGYETGNINTGSNNAFFGHRAGKQNSTGSNNTGIGAFTLFNTLTGSQNTAIGAMALASNNGADNTAVGYSALNINTSGSSNTAVGSSALNANSTGISNVAVGKSALTTNTTGNANTAVGTNALQANTGSDNTAVGGAALQANSSGNMNSAFGRSALGSNTTGLENVAMGNEALLSNINANRNTAIGVWAIRSSLGNNNTALGWHAGTTNTTGNDNTYLGYNANSSVNNLSNATAIGSLAQVGASNSLVLGSINGVNGATADVNVGIGTTTPTARLDVVGTFKLTDGTQGTGKVLTSDASGLASWSTISGESTTASNGLNLSGSDVRLGGTLTGATNIAQAGNALSFTGGNVGIGTTTPGTLLDIRGNSRIWSENISTPVSLGLGRTSTDGEFGVAGNFTDFSNFGNTGDIVIRSNTANLILTARNGTGNISFGSGVGDTRKMIMLNNGNFGIGNGAPSSLFSVGASEQFQVNSSGNIIKINNVTTNFPSAQGTVNTFLRNDGAGNLSWMAVSGESTTASNGLTLLGSDVRLGGTLTQNTTVTQANFNQIFDLTGTGDFEVKKSGATDFIVDASTGNVGVNTSAPAYKTHVVGSLAATATPPTPLDVNVTGGTSTHCNPNSFGQSFQATYTGTISSITIRFNGDISTGNINLDLFNGATNTGGTAYSEVINVPVSPGPGSYTFTLATPFPVVNGSTYSFRLSHQSGCFTGVWVNLINPYPNGDRYSNGALSSGWDLSFMISYSSDGFYANIGGNTGIGTASPSAKLEVAGQVKITGGSPGTGKVLTSDASGLATWESMSGLDATTASNGLTKIGDDIQLGGNLTSNTTINNNSNQLSFNGTATNVLALTSTSSLNGSKTIYADHSGTASTATTISASNNNSSTSNSALNIGLQASAYGTLSGTFSSSYGVNAYASNAELNYGVYGRANNGVELNAGLSGLADDNGATGTVGVIAQITNSGSFYNPVGKHALYADAQSIGNAAVFLNGNVGFRNTTPNAAIQVNGDISLNDNAYGSSPNRIIGFPTRYIGNHGSLTIQAQSNPGSGIAHSGGDLILAGGDFNVSGAGGPYGGNVIIKSGGNIFDGSGGSDIIFQGGGSTVERMRLEGMTGDLGIGTNNPIMRLDVQGGTAAIQGIGNDFSEAVFQDYNGLVFHTFNQAGVGSFSKIIASGSDNGCWGSNMSFYTRPDGCATNVQERMVITNQGNVGVASSTPVGKFNVELGSATSSGNVGVWDNTFALFGSTQSVNGAAVGIGYNSSNGGVLTCLSPGAVWHNMNYLANAHIFKYGSTELMRILNNGQVGIGTATPNASAQMHVIQPSAPQWAIFGENTFSGSQDGIGVRGYANNAYNYGIGGQFWGGFRGVEGYANLYTNIGVGGFFMGGAYGVYATGTGSAGGTIYGVFASASGGTTNWAVYSNGNQFSTTGTAWQVSDQNFKSNIQPLHNALAIVTQLEAKTYEYNQEFTKKGLHLPEGLQYGFLAQDVEKVLPASVMDTKLPLANQTKEKETDYIQAKVYNPGAMLPLAIQSIKELNQKIDNLENENQQLKSKYDDLLKRIEKLEQN